uniref:Uncharacterized protein n=1 Tax=Picea glauca TaxID=3330 RepID=A0A117NJ06_PICGL|nr:hypothetical protein ABT39_MTgene534 [Picea glauca]QHR89409.1 hypothetical protein Q903MT_gene3430 [Picea sitchensis]
MIVGPTQSRPIRTNKKVDPENPTPLINPELTVNEGPRTQLAFSPGRHRTYSLTNACPYEGPNLPVRRANQNQPCM